MFNLFDRVKAIAAERDVPVDWSAGLLGLLVWVLNLSGRLPDPWSLIVFGFFLPFVPVVRTVEQINASSAAEESPNDSYSFANIMTILIGGPLLLLGVWGIFLTS